MCVISNYMLCLGCASVKCIIIKCGHELILIYFPLLFEVLAATYFVEWQNPSHHLHFTKTREAGVELSDWAALELHHRQALN